MRGLDGFDTPLHPEDTQEEGIHMRMNVGGLMSGEAPRQQCDRHLSLTTPRTAFCQQPE